MDGWFRTGDLAVRAPDGYYTLCGRKSDLIISGGFNIYPSDLEGVLRQHTDVADVAVVGVPSERWGETPVAFVVAHAGAKATRDDLLQWTNARVGKFARLAAVAMIKSLPRSPIGKVLKRELRDQYSPDIDGDQESLSRGQ